MVLVFEKVFDGRHECFLLLTFVLSNIRSARHVEKPHSFLIYENWLAENCLIVYPF